MLDEGNTVIYVGKAKDLKKRVSGYFSKTHDDLKTMVLVGHIAAIETIVTRTEQEALILERQLIRELRPRYNIHLKDDKSYPYIKVTVNEPFPRVLVVRQKLNDGARYFGPFPSLGSTRKFQQFLNELFKLRDCTKPIDLVKKQRKCIQLDIGKCIGPCLYKEVKGDYDKSIEQLMLLVKGKNKSLIQQLTAQMKTYSSELAFEKAAVLRDRIKRIEAFSQRQLVDLDSTKHYHIWTAVLDGHTLYVMIQKIIEGKLLVQRGFYSTLKPDESAVGFVMESAFQFYDDDDKDQAEIICRADYESVFKDVITFTNRQKSKVMVPKKGVKMDLLVQAEKNAGLALKRLLSEEKYTEKPMYGDSVLKRMKQRLNLSHLPVTIWGFDISHLKGTDIVASTVCFKKGRPDKSGYRKFTIQSITTESDDFRAMYEVVFRRLNRAVEDGEACPDLLLIDGGPVQLSFSQAAVQKVNGLSVTPDVISLAKREELIFTDPNKDPVKYEAGHPVLRLLQAVRDESHRFALTFQRQKRGKRYLSELESITGNGIQPGRCLISDV